MIITDKDTIIDFLSDVGVDHKGRTYDDMVNSTDEEMEQCHDKIQWIFPLHEESNFAQVCPVINYEIANEAKRKAVVIMNLLIAFSRMEEFYGFGEHHNEEVWKRWCKDGDHNLLRITRIIRCLRLFGLDGVAETFHAEATEAATAMNISQKTLDYWNVALLAPAWDSMKG